MNKKLITFIILGSLFLITLEYTGYVTVDNTDIKVKIHDESSSIKVGENLKFNVAFLNVKEPINFTVDYFIKSIDGDFLIKSEFLIIDQDIILNREIEMPNNLKESTYLLQAKVRDSYVSGSDIFTLVGSDKQDYIGKLSYIIGVLIFISLALFIKMKWPLFSNMDKVRLNFFWWNVKWKLKERKYYLPYLLGIIFILLVILFYLILF